MFSLKNLGWIHPYIDDIPGRKIGTEIGFDAFEYGKSLFEEINMITKSYENNLNNLKFIQIQLRKIKTLQF